MITTVLSSVMEENNATQALPIPGLGLYAIVLSYSTSSGLVWLLLRTTFSASAEEKIHI